jgi:hypothetical protein
LTLRGDCIVGINASNGCADLPISIKEKLKNSNTKVNFIISVGEYKFVVKGCGNENLILTHPTDIVIRKSEFICPRTLAIKCNYSSAEIPREMITLLKNPKIKGNFTIVIE